ncbi:MAG: DUF484 family protein [Pseudomonadota bacterium]
MTSQTAPLSTPELKDQILADPSLVLEDPQIMKALLQLDDAPSDRKVVDLRARLVERLEHRLERLEDTHASVVAAAYENLAGTNQVHRAVLVLLGQSDLASALAALEGEIATILGLDLVRIAVEGDLPTLPEPVAHLVVRMPRGSLRAYLAAGKDVEPRPVTLRPITELADALYGDEADGIASEALLSLDLTRPALLAFGAEDRSRFHPEQGDELLTFFGAVASKVLSRWLSA